MSKRWMASLSGPVTVALLTGCGGWTDGSPGADGTAADASPAVTDGAPTTATDGGLATESAGTPATERGGTETAGPRQDGEVAITVAGLPMGGDTGDADLDDIEQCVSVSYLGDDQDQDLRIPAGFRITVTGGSFAVTPDQFDPDGQLPAAAPVEIDPDGSGCASQGPLCLPGFSFTALNDEADVSCFIPVRATHGTANGGAEDSIYVDVDLEVDGVLTCPRRPKADCEAFADAVRAVADPINFSVPFVPTTTSSSSASRPSFPSSSSSSSSASSSASQPAGETSTSPN